MSELVSYVDNKLKSADYKMIRFTDIAFEALEKISKCFIENIMTKVDIENISSIQRLFENEHYYLNLHSWPNGITNCHCHEFNGAFRVITGSSFHLLWEFNNSKEITPFLYEGELKLISKDVIDSNKTQKIFIGQKLMIHQLIYIERPTITLVLRSKSDLRYSMDEFFYPGLKIKVISNISDAVTELAQCKTKSHILRYIEKSIANQNLDIILNLYSGAIGSNNKFIRVYFKEYQSIIYEIFKNQTWFQLFLEYRSKHNHLINKIIQTTKD